MSKYKGIIIEESLYDNRAINGLEVVGIHITGQDNPLERWHLYTVMVNKEEIERLSNNIKHSWYMHFWRNRKVIVIFRGEKFEFDYDDKSSWKSAVEYGLHVDIPLSQLDFPID